MRQGKGIIGVYDDRHNYACRFDASPRILQRDVRLDAETQLEWQIATVLNFASALLVFG